MNFNEEQVKVAIMRRFGINGTENFEFEVYFKEIEGIYIKEDFDADIIHRVWIGRVSQNDVLKYFVVQLDGLPEEITESTFYSCCECQDVCDFLHQDGKIYNFIYCCDGKKAIIPAWRLDVSKVLRFARLPQSTEWAFERRGEDNKGFYAWVFYPPLGNARIFNIEGGEWHTLATSSEPVLLKIKNCRTKTMKLFRDSGIIRRSV